MDTYISTIQSLLVNQIHTRSNTYDCNLPYPLPNPLSTKTAHLLIKSAPYLTHFGCNLPYSLPNPLST